MERLEMIDKLMERADVTFAEAKEMLEQKDWDLLEAMVALEEQGKVKGAHSTSDSAEGVVYEEVEATASRNAGEGEKEHAGRRLIKFLGTLLRKGMDNKFIVEKNGEIVLTLPVLVLVIIMMISFWFSGILLIVGIFFNYHYSFEGSDLGKDNVNGTVDRVTGAAKKVMDDVASRISKGQKDAEDKKG